MRACTLAMLLLLAHSAAHAADAVLWLTYASPYAPGHPFSLADRAWMQWVEQQSNGRLRIRPLWAGSVLSADQSMLELRHGVADVGLITPIYTRGGAQLIRAQAGFYGGARTFLQQVAMYRCLSQDNPEFARELEGLKVLAVQGGTLPGVLTRTRPVATLADLRGLRLRAPIELLDVLRDLGADPVNMPMGEVYSALAKGVLDGVIAPADTLKSLHFAEVAKFYWRLAVPRGAYPARAMAMRRWLQLPSADQALLESSTQVWERALDAQTRAAVEAGENAGQQEHVHFEDALPEDQQRFDALYERDSERSARELDRYGIAGLQVFQQARGIAHQITLTGAVECSDRRQSAGPRP